MNSIIVRYTPIIVPKDDKFPKWFSKKLIELINDKNYFYDKYKKANEESYNEIFKKKRKEVKQELKSCEKQYTDSIEQAVKTNTKAFFAFTKSLNRSNRFPNVMKLNGHVTDNPFTIANLFAKNFESVYAPADSSIPIDEYSCNCNDHIEITEDIIANVIKQMDENKTNSPDNIPTLFYKRTVVEIVKPLKLIFINSLKQRKFPSQWKLSFLTPLHKSGDKSDIINYRPISITSAASKIFEKIMLLFILDRVQHLISAHQHGFAKSKSTITNLAEYVNFLSTNIANGGQVDSIYTDFAKAFDKLMHRILMRKLDRFPLNNCIKAWIYSFLTDRTQVVCINGTKSNPIHPTSSVPQGCILSPLLFALFINDLPSKLQCSVLLFADDCKIFKSMNCHDDCRLLQNDLNTLSDWCNENKLQLNAGKCAAISFTRRTDRRFQYFAYAINNVNLNRTSVIKDLGVIFDEKLTFKNHVNSIISRASKSLGFICRSLKPFNNLSTYKILYNTYIRSILEYGSSIWNPYYHTQRKFTRILCYKFGFPRDTYQLRLQRLDMQSLFTRRLYFDEMLLYKVVSGKLNTNLIQSFNINVPLRTTRFAPIFYIPSVASNIEYFSLALRLKRQHNDHFSNVDLFDNSLPRTKNIIIQALPTELWPNFS